MYSSRNALRQADSLKHESFQSINRCVRTLSLESTTLTAFLPELSPCPERTVHQRGRNAHLLAPRYHYDYQRPRESLQDIRRPHPRPLSRTETALSLYQNVSSKHSRPFTSQHAPRPEFRFKRDHGLRDYSFEDRNTSDDFGGATHASETSRTNAAITDPGSATTAAQVELLYSQKSSERALKHSGMDSIHSNGSVRIKITEARRPRNLQKVEKVVQQQAEASCKYWDQHSLINPDRVREKQMSWDETFEVLKRHTPLRNDQQQQFTVTGPMEVLLVCYHHLLSLRDVGIDPSFPRGLKDGAYLVFSCPSRKVDWLFSLESIPLHHPELQVLPHDSSIGARTLKSLERSSYVYKSDATATEENVFEPLQSHKHFDPRHLISANFAKQVRRIASYRLPALLVSRINRQRYFSNALEKLFEEVGFAKDVFSHSATCDAISFMLKNARPKQARDLLEKMRKRGYPPTMDVYNCFLKYAAEKHRLDIFNKFLSEALSSGLVFNEGTWTALGLAALENVERYKLLREALRRGFAASPSFARDMTAITLPRTLGPLLDRGWTVTDFVRVTDELYNGPHWLAGYALSGLIDVLGGRCLLIEAVQAIDKWVLQRGMSVPRQPFHTLLAHCWLQQNNPDLAIWLLVYAQQHWSIRNHENVTFELLFNMAWKSYYYNLCRVIWAYSMSSGNARYFMRWRVWKSLAQSQNSLPPEANRKKVFGHHAGSVICGQQHSNSGTLPNANTITFAQRSLLSHRPCRPLADMLVEALLLDKKWATPEYEARRHDRAWLISNVIDVPMTANQVFEDEHEYVASPVAAP